MVKVASLDKNTIRRRERISKLAEIARQEFPLGKVSCNENEAYGFFVYPHNDKPSYLYVSTLVKNEIQVNKPNLLEDAVKLAEVYERRRMFLEAAKNYEKIIELCTSPSEKRKICFGGIDGVQTSLKNFHVIIVGDYN